MLHAVPIARTGAVAVTRYLHPAGERHVDPEEEVAGVFSVCVVESGAFELGLARERATLREGDLWVTRRGTPMRFRHDVERPDDVCVSVDFADEPMPGRPIAPFPRATNRLRYLAGRLSEPDTEALFVDSRAGELLRALFDGNGREARPYGTRQLHWYRDRVDAARTTLETSLLDAPSLAGLSRELGMSPFHFARLFRELVGVPPHRYLVEARLAHAATLLREGLSVTAACHDSGFRNLSHFVRSFRRRFGVTPSSLAGGSLSQESARPSAGPAPDSGA